MESQKEEKVKIVNELLLEIGRIINSKYPGIEITFHTFQEEGFLLSTLLKIRTSEEAEKAKKEEKKTILENAGYQEEKQENGQ